MHCHPVEWTDVIDLFVELVEFVCLFEWGVEMRRRGRRMVGLGLGSDKAISGGGREVRTTKTNKTNKTKNLPSYN